MFSVAPVAPRLWWHDILLNLAEDESVFLRKGEILRHLELCPITIEEIIKEDWPDSVESGGEGEDSKLPLEKKFITSPAEINTHRKVIYKMLKFQQGTRNNLDFFVKNLKISFLRIPLILGRLH